MSVGETSVTSDFVPRRRGRRGRVVRAAIVVVVLAGVGAAGVGVRLGGAKPAAASASISSSTVQVTRRTLSVSSSLNGTLGYGGATPLHAKASGTITWLPAQGKVIRRGDTLMRVDDEPVVVLYGVIPMYRDLKLTTADTGPAAPAAGSTARPTPTPAPTPTPTATPRPLTGNDVHQLEVNLRALGYAGFTVDSTFNSATAVAVKRWQHDLGRPQTGAVDLGDVVFLPGPVRVSQALARVGDDASTDAVSATGLVRSVTVAAPAGDLSWAGLGNRVRVDLPNGRTATGVVAHVGTAASTNPQGGDSGGTADSGGDSQPTVPVAVTIRDQAPLGRLTSGPVTVTYVSQVHKNVLTVPVEALVALAGGGYGLEVVSGSGSHYVAVTPGMFTDALVEVSGGGITAGTTVRVPL